ncbi:ribonuclease H-like domain-containing protein [Myxozyma melibiosi]|uniref:RNA exonuclease 4 n=1 Tax=Myxozyma melibiosi TaxID=54550 RepID=A0ABR1F682_9ASCO
MATTAGLSSNWLALQKKTTKDESLSKTSKKRKLQTAEGKTKVEIKKKKKSKSEGGSKSLESIALEAAKKVIGKEKEQKSSRGKDAELLEWAAENDIGLEDLEEAYGKDKSKTTIGKYVALDCEFVGVGFEGKRSALARVSMVNYHGAIVMDEFVRPEEKVTDWRTWVSGIRPEDMKDAKSFKEVQYKVAEILKDRILVGHAIKNDLKVLMISHPARLIRDTSKLPEFRKLTKGRTPSLKKVAKEILGIEIQGEEHSSIEDARACILLLRKYKEEFDRLAQRGTRGAEEKKGKQLLPATEEA